MTDHLMNKRLTRLGEGHKAGQSLGEFKKSVMGINDNFEKLLTSHVALSSDKLGNSEASIKVFVAPYPIEVTKIWATKTSSADTATVAVAGDGNNLLTAATVDLHGGITADTPASQTLTATPANLKMSAGDLIKATFTCGVAGTLDGGAVVVEFKPIEPFE